MMMIELFEGLLAALRFRDIDPDRICRVDSNVGFIWFKADGETYALDIQQVDFDLENGSETKLTE